MNKEKHKVSLISKKNTNTNTTFLILNKRIVIGNQVGGAPDKPFLLVRQRSYGVIEIIQDRSNGSNFSIGFK